ncbi:hypothetical protein [Buchnera aphidicola]|uniref:hypothetical protein n=1 Tax=Buchnera aphidicola TaxID=9 RepID=UPI00094DAC72|nr:hypothetical protein [Buchnera aphidicola]
MNYKEISDLLKKKLKLYKIFIQGIEKNIEITAIGNIFQNKKTIIKQQLIYQPLMPYFEKKIIHAVKIKTYSILEWKKNLNKFTHYK